MNLAVARRDRVEIAELADPSAPILFGRRRPSTVLR